MPFIWNILLFGKRILRSRDLHGWTADRRFPVSMPFGAAGAGETLAALFNFSEEPQSYALSGLHSQKRPEMLLHSDWEAFGGKIGESEKIAQSISLPAFSGVLLRIEE